MTVNTTTDRNLYDGTGTQFDFPYTFPVLQNADLEVRLIAADGTVSVLVLDTDYTMTGAGTDEGGEVSLISAPAADEQVLVIRVIAYLQPTDFKNQGRFFPRTHEKSFDRVTMQAIRLAGGLARALRLYDEDVDGSGRYDANGNRIADLADGIDPADAATVQQVVAAGSGNFIQAGTGAETRTMQNKVREIVSVLDYGAVGDGVTDDTGAFSDAVTQSLVAGGSIDIPAGIYSVAQAAAPGIEIDAPQTGEPDVDRRSVTLRGDGAGNSVIESGTAAQYAVKLTGGTGVDAHGYENHSDFSIVAGVAGANGLHLFNKAYTSLDSLTLQGCATGLLLESVLSSVVRNVTCGNNSVYGCRALKGAGFSGVNSVTFDSCNFRSNVALGFETEAFVTDLTFVNCNFENNGRFGQAAEGGCRLTFNGSEGRSGAVFIGGYFESNAGGADLFLTNTGTDYVTVVLIGTNFNRNVAATYVTNCIQTAGKIRLVLRGCTFSSYNGYTPSAGRPYIDGDSDLILEHDGCEFKDALETPTVLAISARLSYAGSVDSAGAALKLPDGWSCSSLGTGSYRVTHNLAFASVNDYAVTAQTSNGGTSIVLAVAKATNGFDVTTVNPSFSSTNAQFDFTLTRI